ncbi:MAG TPA: glycosyltransferase, partial [Chthoniobacterales bacterium]|nr:glycosyltransferase [Chthoniobacterales bacterium]
LLPSLNSRRFLEARVDSILRQTLARWEAIVLDSHSTDGSWEFFQSIAGRDPRFRIYQVPREGLYAALNRGLEIATGDFFYIAPCDDTMLPEFFSEMIEALEGRADVGVAACDCLFINQNGDELRLEDMRPRLSEKQIRNLLSSGKVRSSLLSVSQRKTNYRPAPHDCLLHFTGRSVYFSLTQLLVRTSSAKEAGFFETSVGSAADFCWLVRLTSLTDTVHLPKRLATWRFHGDQLSLQKDNTRLAVMSKTCENILPEIRKRYPALLTNRDCKLLLVPYRIFLARSVIARIARWLQGFVLILGTSLRAPVATVRAFRQSGFGRNLPVALVLQRRKLFPRPADTLS